MNGRAVNKQPVLKKMSDTLYTYLLDHTREPKVSPRPPPSPARNASRPLKPTARRGCRCQARVQYKLFCHLDVSNRRWDASSRRWRRFLATLQLTRRRIESLGGDCSPLLNHRVESTDGISTHAPQTRDPIVRAPSPLWPRDSQRREPAPNLLKFNRPLLLDKRRMRFRMRCLAASVLRRNRDGQPTARPTR